MAGSRTYGDAVAHSLGLRSQPSVKTRSLQSCQVAVQRLSIGPEQFGLSPRIPAEDSFILAYYLTDLPYHELWSRGQLALAQGYGMGSMRIVNLAGDYAARIAHSHETMAFYIPRSALDDAAQHLGCGPVSNLTCRPGIGDPVIHHLAQSLLPSLCNPGQTSQLFIDHVVGAMLIHLTQHYGATAGRHSSPAKGGLSPYQVERAKEFLSATCERDVSLAEVADLCGFSRGYFAKAFRASVGSTPHRWRQRYRIDRAKDMLSRTDKSVADIALACGFADQSHFTRIFSRMVGEGPAGWRRRQSRS